MLGRNALLALLIYFLGLTLAIPNLVADKVPPPDPTVPANSAGLATISAEIHKRDVDPDDERIKCDTTPASPPDNDITDVLSIIRGSFALTHCDGQGSMSGLGCQSDFLCMRRSGFAMLLRGVIVACRFSKRSPRFKRSANGILTASGLAAGICCRKEGFGVFIYQI